MVVFNLLGALPRKETKSAKHSSPCQYMSFVIHDHTTTVRNDENSIGFKLTKTIRDHGKTQQMLPNDSYTSINNIQLILCTFISCNFTVFDESVPASMNIRNHSKNFIITPRHHLKACKSIMRTYFSQFSRCCRNRGDISLVPCYLV